MVPENGMVRDRNGKKINISELPKTKCYLSLLQPTVNFNQAAALVDKYGVQV
jgi:hypothetical protein